MGWLYSCLYCALWAVNHRVPSTNYSHICICMHTHKNTSNCSTLGFIVVDETEDISQQTLERSSSRVIIQGRLGQRYSLSLIRFPIIYFQCAVSSLIIIMILWFKKKTEWHTYHNTHNRNISFVVHNLAKSGHVSLLEMWMQQKNNNARSFLVIRNPVIIKSFLL